MNKLLKIDRLGIGMRKLNRHAAPRKRQTALPVLERAQTDSLIQERTPGVPKPIEKQVSVNVPMGCQNALEKRLSLNRSKTIMLAPIGNSAKNKNGSTLKLQTLPSVQSLSSTKSPIKVQNQLQMKIDELRK